MNPQYAALTVLVLQAASAQAGSNAPFVFQSKPAAKGPESRYTT